MTAMRIDFALKPYGYQEAPTANVWRANGDWWLYRTDGYTGLMTLVLVSLTPEPIRRELCRLRARRTATKVYR